MKTFTLSTVTGLSCLLANRIKSHSSKLCYIIFIIALVFPLYSLAQDQKKNTLSSEIEEIINDESLIYGDIKSVHATLKGCTLNLHKKYKRYCSGLQTLEYPTSIRIYVKLDELTAKKSEIIINNYAYQENAVILHWPLNNIAEEKRATIWEFYGKIKSKYSKKGYSNVKRLLQITKDVEPFYIKTGLQTKSYLEFCGNRAALDSPTLLFTNIFEEGNAKDIISKILNYKKNYCQN